MKPVSAAYRQSMKQNMRNRSFVRVTMFLEDPSAIEDGGWADTGLTPYSEYDTLGYSYDYGKTYATLELNRWTLDGQQMLIEEGEGYTEQGVILDSVSDGEGNFSDPPTLTRTFTTDHALHGLTLTFDSRCGDWPTNLTVRFYRLGELVDEQTVDVTTQTAVILTEQDYVDAVQIAFNAALPYHRPRVEYVLYGIQVTYDGAKVSTLTQSHDIDPLSRRLPKETASVTLLDYSNDYDPDNPTGFFRYIEEKARLRIQHGYTVKVGTVEWIDPDEYLLDGKPNVANHKALFSSTGMIGSLTGVFYKSKLGAKNLYDMAEEVLLDAALTPTATGGNPWVIDDSLKAMFTEAVLPIDTHMNCLQLIAHAARCTLYTDDENIIHIEPFGVTVKGIYAGVWADNGETWYSEWGTVDSGNDGTMPFASLELNRWVLDGGMDIISADAPEGRGYVSNGMMAANGTSDTAPMFSKIFNTSHDLSVLALRFDNLAEIFPHTVQVCYYKEDELVDTRIEEVLDSTAYIYSDAANDCTSIEVYMLSGLPYHRFRVSKVYYREDDFTLDFNTISEDSMETTKIDKLQAVTVAVYHYTKAAQEGKLHESTTTAETLHIEFSDVVTDLNISVSGGTLISSTIYGRAADLVLSEGTKTVTINGYSMEQSNSIFTMEVSSTGEVDVEENPLITDYDMAEALAKHIAAYLTMRNTYDVSYRGNPELETQDIIGLQTDYTPEMDALVLVDEITYNGALSGKMKVKGLI